MATSRRPTITAVASHAGVSPMTVSRVLDGRSTVVPRARRPGARFRCCLGIPTQRAGAEPASGSAIRAGRGGDHQRGEPVLRAVPAGGRGGAGRDRPDPHDRQHRRSPGREERLVAEFIGRQVEGLLMVPTGRRTICCLGRLSGVRWCWPRGRCPGSVPTRSSWPTSRARYEGTTALLERGHRAIGFLGSGMSSFTGGRRLDGFRLAHEDAGVRSATSCCGRTARRSPMTRITTESVAESLLHEHPDLTAVLCANNRNTVGLVRALARRGGLGRSADELTVLAFDDFELADVVDVAAPGHRPRRARAGPLRSQDADRATERRVRRTRPADRAADQLCTYLLDGPSPAPSLGLPRQPLASTDGNVTSCRF